MKAGHASTQNEDKQVGDDEIPAVLRQDTPTALVLREKIWRPVNRKNDWRAFVMVGREGSGKSYTTGSILEKADPTFTAARVFFRPEELLAAVAEMSKAEREGKAIMLDESGVGMGVRSWYDKDQVQFNKVMQTVRDDNMILAATLPRFSELDSMFRARLHGFCEMHDVRPGDHAVWSWRNIVVSRDEEDGMIKPFPRREAGGRTQKLRRLRIGPPSEEWQREYEEAKSAFQQELYEETVEQMRDDDEDRSPKQIAQEILDEGKVERYIGDNHGQKYIDRTKLAAEYEIGGSRAKRVKKLLMEEVDEDVI